MRAESLLRSARRRRGSRCCGLSLVELLVVIAVIGLVIGFLIPNYVRNVRVREVARRTLCRNNLKQIGLALHNYYDEFGAFPPAYTVDASGRKLHSWRTLLLPYLDQASLYRKVDLSKPWDDPVNAELTRTSIPVYKCLVLKEDSNRTTYHAVVSAESILRPEKSLTFPEITDGSSNTLLVVEVDSDGAVPWASPEDRGAEYLLTVSEKTVTSHEGGSHGLLGDGAVRFLQKKVPADGRRGLITAAAGDKTPED